jgi:flagellar biosynthetic protein FlhB
VFGGRLAASLVGLARDQIGGQWLERGLQLRPDDAVAQWNATLSTLGGHLLPILGILLAGAVAASVLQTGFLFLPQRLKFDAARLDPVKGLGRVFSPENLVQTLFGLLKIAAIAAVAAASLYAERATILGMSAMDGPRMAEALGHVMATAALRIGVALVVLALADYGFRRWKHEQDLKMTPQELREEMKRLEGRPEIATRRKRLRRKLVADRRTGPDGARPAE